MHIGVACGGTGGHLYPGLAAAAVLRRRGHAVTLWLAGKPGETTAVAGWDGPAETIPARGLAGQGPGARAAALAGLGLAAARCLARLRRRRPDVLLAMGSYASIAPALAARCLGVPLVLHEANVVPGRAIRFLAPFAAAVALGFPETRGALRHRRLADTGIPVGDRPPPAGAAPGDADWAALAPGRFTVLVMGGSRGARRLNDTASRALASLAGIGCSLQAIHLTGIEDQAEVRARYRAAGLPHAVFAFLHDMPRAYRQAALAICRSGAATCAELALYGVPAMLVPYPFAADGHQLANARALEAAGAAEVLLETDLTPDRLRDELAACAARPEPLAARRAAALRRAAPRAAEDLADLVEQLARSQD